MPKYREIEKVVKLTKIEESRYRNEVEELSKLVETSLEDVAEDTLLNSMLEVEERILSALGNLKEVLISCGEHSDISKCKNAKEQVFSDSKNVSFRLFCAKKKEIEKLIEPTLLKLCDEADVYWLKEDFAEVMNQYDRVVDVIFMIDELNGCFDQLMNKDEDNSNQFTTKKRGMNRRQVLPRKVAKLEVEVEKDEVKLKAKEEAEAAMIEVKKNAMRPILIHSLSYVRFARGLKELEIFPKIRKRLTALKRRMGGDKKILARQEECLKIETKHLEIVKAEQLKMFEEWEENQDQHVPMKNVLEHLKETYQSKNSDEFLIGKLVSPLRLPALLKDMPFWPVFANSTRHFVDGMKKRQPEAYDYVLRLGHKKSQCMGICNMQSVEDISRNYKHSTSSQVLQKMRDFIDNLETMREELFNGYLNLIDFFMKNPSVLLETDTFNCSHKVLERMCISEKARKREHKKLKCRICAVQHTLAHLRFAIGTGSYHGIIRSTAKDPIQSFFSLVLAFEMGRERNDDFCGMMQLVSFLAYLTRLGEAAGRIQSSIEILMKYCYFMNCIFAEDRKIEVTLKTNLCEDRANCFAQKNQLSFNDYNEKLKTACQELRYLMSLYGKKQMSDDCTICYSRLEIIANYPCGHVSCEECYRKLRKASLNLEDEMFFEKQCVTCRKTFEHGDMILERRNVTGNSEVMLSAKLEATIRLMKEIIEEDSENNKILLFTTMEFGTPIWQFLTKVLQKAKLPFNEVTQTDDDKSFCDFQSSVEPKILLFSLSKKIGVNLTHANHIIYLDPTRLSPIIEKAVKLTHRYGQKRDMKVYHMLVEGSIDEKIWKIVKATKNVQKGDKEFTVGELRKIIG